MDPATIAAIGTVAGGIGSIAQGFGLGQKKGPDPGSLMRLQQEFSLEHERRSFDQRMQLAQEHGIHPLSVLGVPVSSFSPSVTVGGETGTDFRDIGYGVSQIAKGLVRPGGADAEQAPAPVVDATEGLRLRMMEAQVRTAEANAIKAENDVGWLYGPHRNPGLPPAAQGSNDVDAMLNTVAAQSGIPRSYLGTGGGGRDAAVRVEQAVAPPHPSIPGHAAASDQGWARIVDKSGDQVSVVRNDAIQAEIEQGATFQALAQVYGIERALQVSALLENQHLLMGVAAAGGYLLRHPAARIAKFLLEKAGLSGKSVTRVLKSLRSRKGRIYSQEAK